MNKSCHGWTLALLLCCLLPGACRRSGSQTPPPATTQATTQPALPDRAVLNISGEAITFPPVQVSLDDTTDHLMLTFITTGEQKDGSANSLYLEMKLDITQRSDLGTVRWLYRDASDAFVESPVCVTLGRYNRIFQPKDVRAEFEDLGRTLRVRLEGEFSMFDTLHSNRAIGTATFVGVFDAIISEK